MFNETTNRPNHANLDHQDPIQA